MIPFIDVKTRLVVIVLIILGACHKGGTSAPPCPQFEMPNAFQFEIKENGQFVTDSVFLGQLKLVYADNGKTVTDCTLSNGVFLADGITHRLFSSVNVELSGSFGTTAFYLEYPDGSRDNIYVSVTRTAATNCEYVFNEAKFNNIVAKTDTLFVVNGDSTYVLNHQ
jgi:hypothetical protein